MEKAYYLLSDGEIKTCEVVFDGLDSLLKTHVGLAYSSKIVHAECYNARFEPVPDGSPMGQLGRRYTWAPGNRRDEAAAALATHEAELDTPLPVVTGDIEYHDELRALLGLS